MIQEFRDSNKSLKHEFKAQFKDSVSHMCLAGAVVASWSLIQEVADSSPFTVMTNNFQRIQGKILEKTQIDLTESNCDQHVVLTCHLTFMVNS